MKALGLILLLAACSTAQPTGPGQRDLAPVRLARDLGIAAVNRIAPLRRAFMHEAGGATGDLPRLLRGQGL